MGTFPKFDLYPDRYVIATPDASTEERARADLDLSQVANVSTALQTALNDHEKVYIVGNSITMPAGSQIIVTSSIDILADDCYITIPSDAPTSSATSAPIIIGDSATGTTTTGTGTWTVGSRVVTVANGSLFSPRDWVKFRSSEIANVNRSVTAPYTKTAIHRIASVSGNTLTLESGLRWSYTTPSAITVNKINMIENVKMENMGFVNPSDTTSPTMVNFMNCRLPRLEHCWLKGGDQTIHGFRFSGCYKPILNNIYVEGCNHPNTGYGIHLESCGAIITNLTSFECRHVVSSGQSWTAWPYPNDLVIRDATAYHSTAMAWDTHGADHVYYQNLTAYSCGGGVHLRGGEATIIGLHVYGARSDGQDNVALNLGENSGSFELAEDSGLGPGGTRVYVRDFVVDQMSTTDGLGTSLMYGLVTLDPLVDSDIEMTFRGVRDPVQLKGLYNRRSRIALKMHDNSGLRAGGYGTITIFNGNSGGETNASVAGYSESLDIEVMADWLDYTPVRMYGGTNGGTTKNCHYKFDISAWSAHGTPVALECLTGTHGSHYLDRVHLASGLGEWRNTSGTGPQVYKTDYALAIAG